MFLSKSETQEWSEGEARKTQFCFVSAQLHGVSIFCLSKCHSWKFRLIILGFNRPKENSVFAVHDKKCLKLLTRPRLKFSHLNEHKFRHDFRDTVDPMCKFGLELETALHFLLSWRLYSTIRTELVDDTSTVDSPLTNYPDEKLLNILLHGSEYFSVKTNRSTLQWNFSKILNALMTHCF